MNYHNTFLKLLILSIIIITFNNCTQEYGKLNRSMLHDKRNQKFWDYYHSVDYCKRIDIIDSVFSFNLNINNSNFLNENEKRSILSNQLYQLQPNSFYGYMFFDLREKADTSCCADVFISEVYFENYWFVEHEAPPDFKNIENLKKNIKLWKEKLNCE